MRIHRAFFIVPIGCLTVLGSLGFGRFSYALFLPGMEKTLGWSTAGAGVVASFAFGGYLLGAVSAGGLASRFGPRRVIFPSMVLVALGLALTALSQGYALALIGQILTGLGTGGANVPVMALGMSWVGRRWRALASGLLVAGSGIGLVISGALVPALAAAYGGEGWRYGWALLALGSLLLGILGYLVFRDRPEDVGLRPLGESGGSGTAEPLRTFSRRLVWHLGVIYFMFGLSYVAFTTFFGAYLTADRGFSLAAAGSLWSWVGIGTLPSGIIWGFVADRIGHRRGLALVYILQGGFLLLFGLALTRLDIVWSALAYSLMLWSVPAIMAAMVLDYFGRSLAAAALGILTLFFGVGQLLAPVLSGLLAQSTGSFGPVFALLALGPTAGALLALLLPRDERQPATLSVN